MRGAPATRPSLLVRLRDAQDQDAWRQLVELYGPLVYRFARKRGLQDADAADLTQAVLLAVGGSIHRLDYDPGQGSFRGWLFTVARYQLNNFLARSRRAVHGVGGTDALRRLEEQPAPKGADEALWEQEYRQQRFLWAAERCRGAFEEASWRAFWLTAVEGKSPAEAARDLGLSVGAVYTAKSRVLTRIRQELEQAPDE